jgi:hypothetical protein
MKKHLVAIFICCIALQVFGLESQERKLWYDVPAEVWVEADLNSKGSLGGREG